MYSVEVGSGKSFIYDPVVKTIEVFRPDGSCAIIKQLGLRNNLSGDGGRHKMKSKLIISLLLICVIFLCLFAGCFSKAEVLTQYENEAGSISLPEKTKPVQEPPRPTDKENKTIEDITYNLASKKGVHIEYPSFVSLAYDELNTEIFRVAMLRMEFWQEKDIINQDYEIVFQNDEYISILFKGSHRSSAPYPVQYVNCLNWDMKNDSLLTLSAEQKQDIAEILPECIAASGLLPEQKEYLQQNAAEGYLSLVKDEALYMKDDGLCIVLEVPHAVGDYVEISLEKYYQAERFLGNNKKLSQNDIMSIAIANGNENPYAGYYASPFSDDVIYAKQSAIEADDAGFDISVYDIYLNDVSVAQTKLMDAKALNVQWLNKDTALLMHIFLLDKSKGIISPIAGEGLIEMVFDLVSFNDLSCNMNGDRRLLNSVADSQNNCVYYAFSNPANYDYEVYRYDLKTQQWDMLFVDAASLTEYSWLEMFCNGEKLYCGNLNGYYVIDLASRVVQRINTVDYISPDGKYAMVYDTETGSSLQNLETGEVILDFGINDGLWLDEEFFVYSSNSRITFFSVKDKGIVRTKTVDKSSNIELDYAHGVLYYYPSKY
ncbi:MAG: hypothetical protein IJP33_02475 [Firmicutes bacterium]|nr:hypothetical protein [Bacillota bacterium]